MATKPRKSMVELPIAKFFRAFSGERGFQQPQAITLASPAMASVTTSPATQNAILHQSTVGLGQSHLVSCDTLFRATRLAGLVSDSRSRLGALDRKTPRVRSVLVADLRR